MNVVDAVKSVLSQYAGFSGRARRSEFWWFYLFSVLVQIVAVVVDAAVFGGPVLQAIVALALIVPSLAVGARRLHDTGRSGWWQLISLIPIIGAIVLIVWWASDSHGSNEYGPSPKGVGGAVV